MTADAKIFQFSKENLGHYEIRFLPNISNANDSFLSLRSFIHHYKWFHIHMCRALVNGEIKLFLFGNVIKKEFSKDGNPFYQMWVIKEGWYLDINTSIKHDFIKVDAKWKEKDEYKYVSDSDKENILKKYNSISTQYLIDVYYNEMNKRAHMEYKVNDSTIKMLNIYKQEAPDFEEQYKIYLRKEKLKKIMP